MANKGIFEEIVEQVEKAAEEYYVPLINDLSSSNEQLSSQNDYLKDLLKQHNIQFE